MYFNGVILFALVLVLYCQVTVISATRNVEAHLAKMDDTFGRIEQTMARIETVQGKAFHKMAEDMDYAIVILENIYLNQGIEKIAKDSK